jgi:hypothetical protein
MTTLLATQEVKCAGACCYSFSSLCLLLSRARKGESEVKGEPSAHVPPLALSPSLASDTQIGDAYELKFLLTVEEAAAVEAWARRRLPPDPHGEDGAYRTTSLYLDTPFFDVFHKSPGHRRSKYRVRRYGAGDLVHLERKKRRGDRVRKHREPLPLVELPRLLEAGCPLTWFASRICERMLGPVCCVGYTRTAFVAGSSEAPMRLTLDREVVGAPAEGWTVPEHIEGRKLLIGEAILELKFRDALPGLFRVLLDTLPTRPAGGSKYARCVKAWDLARTSK